MYQLESIYVIRKGELPNPKGIWFSGEVIIKMKKAILSQPMAGKTNEEIVATRERAVKVLEVLYEE